MTASAREALRGVETVFLYPVRGAVDGFLAAARAADVEHIVLLSSPGSYEPREYKTLIGQVHRAMEQSLERSGLPHTVLYPSWLAGNALRDWGEQVRTSERVDLAFPDAQFTPIHPDDIAEVAADLLTRDTHRGRMQILTGPESMRLRDVVTALGEEIGRTLTVGELTPEQALERRESWMPEPVLRALLDTSAAAVGVPTPVNNSVLRITGHRARTFRAWARTHRADFLPDPVPESQPTP
nr:NAD(P)H-binding protein [Streptomyces sp. 150FB]